MTSARRRGARRSAVKSPPRRRSPRRCRRTRSGNRWAMATPSGIVATPPTARAMPRIQSTFPARPYTTRFTTVPGATSARPIPCAVACPIAWRVVISGTVRSEPPTPNTPETKPPTRPRPTAIRGGIRASGSTRSPRLGSGARRTGRARGGTRRSPTRSAPGRSRDGQPRAHMVENGASSARSPAPRASNPR